MRDNLSKNAKKVIQYLADDPIDTPNINQIARHLKISVGSSHKILKEFEKDEIVLSKPVGNSIIYTLNFKNPAAKNLLEKIKIKKHLIRTKRTKIVCTIGPATNNVETIKKLIAQGMDVARINGAHGTDESNLEIIKNIEKASTKIPILLDIPGPKIRITGLNGEVPVKKNQKIAFTAEPKNNGICVDYPELPRMVHTGDIFLIDDGAVKFKIQNVKGNDLICTVLNDGVIKNRKGLNFPGISFERNYLSERDKQLVFFAKKHNLSFLGLSYVNSKDDIECVESLIVETPIKIISKIETKKAIENYFEIIDKSYGVMIDRGDLGSEVSIEKLPKLQKRIIRECNNQGKPVIIATQMMDSMTRNPFPTKSEITDVANAVLDGASALMLSGETAVGSYPLETVNMMKSIIDEIEDEVSYDVQDERIDNDNYTDVIGYTINQILKKIDIDKIICITHGGYSARMLSRYKFKVPLIAITNDPNIVKRMNLLWGVIPLIVREDIDNSASVKQKKTAILNTMKQGLVNIDDTVLLVGAVFPNNRKIINMVEIHKIQEILGFFEMMKT